MLKYKVIKQRNALHESKEEMYYVRLTKSVKYDLDQVAETIADRSALTKADVVATLVSLENLIPKLLIDGCRVELGNLGTFSLQAESESSKDESKISWRSFKKLTTRFRPGKALKIHLSSVKFRQSE